VTPRVFISYTAEDLRELAGVVRDTVRRLEWIAVDHTDWAPTGHPSVPECRQRVERSDILVVLTAYRYGWVPSVEEGGDGRTSITWLEVRWARAAGKQVIPYVVSPDASWPVQQIEERTRPEVRSPLQEFQAELRQSIAKFFSDRTSLLETLESALRAAAERSSDGDVPPAERSGPRRGVLVPPDGLPYLCNRDEQERLIRAAVRDHVRGPRHRPLLLVVHGPASEAHRPFVDRLQNDTFPGFLKGLGVTGQLLFLHITRQLPAGSAFADDFRMQMATEMQVDLPTDDAAFVEMIRRQRIGGIVPVVTLLAREYGRDARAPLARLHDYWAAFPDLPAPLFVLCLVCVKYEAGPAEGGGGWRLFGRWRTSGSADGLLREAVVESAGLYGGGPLGWHVLPELPQVRPEHVDRWTDRVRQWVGYVSSERRQAIFDGEDSLPMETVAPRLQQLVLEPRSR
jgi:hypothetical protein